jgi:pyridinium-3,5-bisthiocarboxylic acid mononucleotide nickel chelatase
MTKSKLSSRQKSSASMTFRGSHLHYDPTSGIAGDMAVAALVSLGVPGDVVTDAVAAIGVSGLSTAFEERKRGGMMGLGFVVDWPERQAAAPKVFRRKPRMGKLTAHSHDGHTHSHDGHTHSHDGHTHSHDGHTHSHDGHTHSHDGHTQSSHAHGHRDYAVIRKLLKDASLDAGARKLAEEIFERIALVEAEVHGIKVDAVGFHEVGAYDSIADIVGFAAAYAWLAPSSVSSSPPVLGSGQVRTAHGVIPVPAPATALLLKGVPIQSGGFGELVTPTGAAILAATVSRFGELPAMVMQGVGIGAGTRETSDRPNVLRVIAGVSLARAANPDSTLLMLETNVDDMNPELVPVLLDALLAAGSLDAWVTPILMKKGRPAFQVGALVPPPLRDAVESALFANSTTLGVRVSRVERTILDRVQTSVKTAHGNVAVKLAVQAERVVGASPEFESCRTLAERHKIPVRQIMAEAAAAAHAWLGKKPPKG